MKCIKCGCSAMERPLFRTKPKGQSDMGAMCMPCMEVHEPELAKNEKADITPVEKELHSMFYPKKNRPT